MTRRKRKLIENDVRVIRARWHDDLAIGFASKESRIRIVCPFIKKDALSRFLKACRGKEVQVITRLNENEFAEGVSDISSLESLLALGAKVRGVQHVHAKLYAFGETMAIVTSANLTVSAISRNHELGVLLSATSSVADCIEYFDELWRKAERNVTSEDIAEMKAQVSKYLRRYGKPTGAKGLRDLGRRVRLHPRAGPTAPASAFVKFLGQGDEREPLSYACLEEVRRSGCNTVLAYPARKHPVSVRDGDTMFIARLTSEPNDIRVFGVAVAKRHRPGVDEATAADIAKRSWRNQWSNYVRVSDATFVAGPFANAVSLNELMDELKSDTFASTQLNRRNGSGNINPRTAYRQQAQAKLSTRAAERLAEKLDEAFERYGTLKSSAIDDID